MKVLIVDDSKADVMMISSMLNDYEILIACDGTEAMALIGREKGIDIMILDLNMPRMTGFEVLEAMKSSPDSSGIATIILTNYDEIDNEIKGLDLGAVDYIRKPLNIRALRKRLELHINLKNARELLVQQNYVLEKTVRERTRECTITRDVTIHALLGLLEIRNIESCNHTKRTQWMMIALCNHLRKKEHYNRILTEDYTRELFSTSPLHDIGKVGIPDSILLKPGKLTAEEFEIMKLHTTYGVDALKYEGNEPIEISFIKTASELIGTHHEKFDGTGYPNGLKGAEIPLSGRLMAIIDVYDALVSVRVYKSAFSHAEAMHIIADGRNKHFDPEIADAFFEIEDEIKAIVNKYT